MKKGDGKIRNKTHEGEKIRNENAPSPRNAEAEIHKKLLERNSYKRVLQWQKCEPFASHVKRTSSAKRPKLFPTQEDYDQIAKAKNLYFIISRLVMLSLLSQFFF